MRASRMHRPVRALQALVVLAVCARVFLADCPRLCECKWKSGKESVICLSANLSVVPTHLDAGTQILDLTANNLVAIRHDEFSRAGLLNLQKIYAPKCRLKAIERYAFRHLMNLVELDLGHNALAAVPSHALDSIPELRELKLNGNPIQKVGRDAFAHVPQLVRLELSDCRIATIEAGAFDGLERSLEWLKLDGNRLVDVDAGALTVLDNLHGVELAANPWNCSCGLRALREWMVRRNVPSGVPPTCTQPERLRMRGWDKLDLDEFACAPAIVARDAQAHGVEGSNVTMTCRVVGEPTPSVRWSLRNRAIASLSGGRPYVVRLQDGASELTILAADAQDAGVYVCAAENKAGRAEASVTLAVARRPAGGGALGGTALVVSVIAGVLFALCVCLAALCACALRKRNPNRWRGRTCRSGDDDYEKIEMGRKPVENVNGRVGGAELASVGSRKNGDYRVVPGADTDQEQEEDDDDDAKKQRETKFWTRPLHDTKIETQWDAGDRLMDNQEDLHIPRRPKHSASESRDDLAKTPTSTSGTYNAYQLPSTSTGRAPPPLSVAQRGKTKEPPTYATAAFATDLSSLLEGDERKYPDLIEHSPNVANNNNNHVVASKANSEGGGSVNDIGELFCTLPRKRAPPPRYASTDSQSPLLADSRYGSSGDDDVVHGPRSNSTPLLDVASLERRIAIARRPSPQPPPPPPTANLNAYDYHAAQLERFLEEYRALQQELARMKQTCDNMRQDRHLDPMQNSLPSTCEQLKPAASPNSNTTPGAVTNFDGDLTRYLLKSSPKPINNSGLFNN